MEEDRLKELSQEIFETAFGYYSDLDNWSKSELIENMASIQDYASELQELVGNSTTIQYIGFDSTIKPSAKAEALYSQNEEVKDET